MVGGGGGGDLITCYWTWEREGWITSCWTYGRKAGSPLVGLEVRRLDHLPLDLGKEGWITCCWT